MIYRIWVLMGDLGEDLRKQEFTLNCQGQFYDLINLICRMADWKETKATMYKEVTGIHIHQETWVFDVLWLAQ
jgi:hypothetical protein